MGKKQGVALLAALDAKNGSVKFGTNHNASLFHTNQED